MFIDTTFMPGWMNPAAYALAAVFLSLAGLYAPWRALQQVPGRVHLACLCILACTGLWSMQAPLSASLSIHFLGITSVTLLLGWSLALLCGASAMLLTTLLAGLSPASIPLAWLVSVVAPASISYMLLSRLPRQQNLFIYTLGGGFAGGMLSALATALLVMAVLALSSHPPVLENSVDLLPVLALLMFPEGFINGMLVTAVCVFFPDAVKTFDDRFYFQKRGADE